MSFEFGNCVVRLAEDDRTPLTVLVPLLFYTDGFDRPLSKQHCGEELRRLETHRFPKRLLIQCDRLNLSARSSPSDEDRAIAW